ncbi:hypothetical protein HNP46_003045 [Pseudomonas nitritireducens]|uniref:Uncharacterized protein n=1 Tax=Pseudomonas nitroreducens TaxID=46680 RepID=A0A7W7KKJ4_PSENT|nr:hypothetical protein [Pseudomonas nitritireducens]MBB4864181.1 hypothetical protein [Pseudomonas nitritireducens]
MNALTAFERGSERFPHWNEELLDTSEPGFCGPNEMEVGFLLPQLIATPGCPSRSRTVEIGTALMRWLKRAPQTTPQHEGTRT